MIRKKKNKKDKAGKRGKKKKEELAGTLYANPCMNQVFFQIITGEQIHEGEHEGDKVSLLFIVPANEQTKIPSSFISVLKT